MNRSERVLPTLIVELIALLDERSLHLHRATPRDLATDRCFPFEEPRDFLPEKTIRRSNFSPRIYLDFQLTVGKTDCCRIVPVPLSTSFLNVLIDALQGVESSGMLYEGTDE